MKLAACALVTLYVLTSALRLATGSPQPRTLVFMSEHTSQSGRAGIASYLVDNHGSAWRTYDTRTYDFMRPGLRYRCVVKPGPVLFFADEVRSCKPLAN